ncbi:MAG TPA: oligosaccharide flippase family protein [Solirubrobacteraceae bacterium]
MVEHEAGDAGGRRHVAESVATLAAGDAINKSARFAAIVVLTRALPLDQYGLLNLGVALGGIAVVIMRLGLPDLGAREIAIAPGRREELAARIVTPQVVGLVTLTLLACAVVLAVEPRSAPFVLLSGASTLGLALSADWLLRGSGRMIALAISSALGGLVALGGALVVAASSDSATAGLAALALGELAAAAWTWRSAQLRRLPRPTLRGLSRLLRQSWPLAIAGAVTYAYTANIDTVLLAAIRSVEEAGLYSAPYRLFLALNAVGVFAAYALLPFASRAFDAGAGAEAERLIVSCLPALAGFGLLCLGIAELLGAQVLEILFGKPFAAMSTTFLLLCAALPWYAIGYPAGYSAIASGRHRRLLAGASVAAALNIILNIALIAPLGAEGAAVATTVAVLAAALTWLAVQRLLVRVLPLICILAVATVAAAAVATVDAIRAEVGVATLATGLGLLLVGGPDGLKRVLRERSRPRRA